MFASSGDSIVPLMTKWKYKIMTKCELEHNKQAF